MIPPLHGYQRTGVAFLKGRPRAGLWLEPGLGKTATVLSALGPEHLPVLVVAPKRVATEVWPEETALWRPDLTVDLAVGSPERRQNVLKTSKADIVVIGRDVLYDAVDHRSRFNTFVVDESSGFKTKSSVRWRAGNKIAKVVSHVWLLTGTPSPNSLMDIWAQVALLDQGQRLGTGLGHYRNRYFHIGKQLPSGIVTRWDINDDSEEKIYNQINDIVLSMQTDGLLKLPAFTIVREKVVLPAHARRIYDDLEADLVSDMGFLSGSIHTAANAAVLSAKLSQVTAGFLYHDDQDIRDDGDKHDHIHTAKLDRLVEIREEVDSPLLVFYRFKAEKEAILKRFPEAKTTDEPNFQKKWNDGEISMLVAHPASAGHGLNLQKGPGHHLVWTSGTWSLEEWDQANARLMRQGQANPVVCHVLTCPSTVDTAINARLIDKKSIQDALMSYLEIL